MPATHRRVWDFTRDGIRRSLTESLERLGLDRVDIVYLHDPDEHWAEVLETGYPALAELRDEGVVKAIGAGMNQASMLADLVRETDVDVVMLAGRYTLLEQDSLDDLLPLCEERRVGVVAAGVFNSGLLAQPAASERGEVRLRDGSTGTPRPSSDDRRHLRSSWDDLARCRDRVPARPPRGRQRLPGRPVGEAGAEKRRPLRPSRFPLTSGRS